MCDVKDCEFDLFIGSRGVCNFTLGVCICPSGFSGRDDWSLFNSCHVSDKVSNEFHIVALTLCLVDAVLILFSLFYFSSKVGFTPDPHQVLLRKNSKESSKETTATPPSTPRLKLLAPPKPQNELTAMTNRANASK